MVRNVEFETFGGGRKSVNQSVRAFDEPDQYTSAKRDLAEGHAFLYHLAEGTDPGSDQGLRRATGPRLPAAQVDRDPFHRPGPAPVHRMARHGKGGLDRVVAVLEPVALRKDHRRRGRRHGRAAVCLGADWSPSGSKSVLGELKVADLHNQAALGGALSDHDICAMVTCNPARALGWEKQVGQLKAGLHADFVVMSDKGKEPYRTLIESVEADVQLVAINGYPIYGTAHLMTAASAVNPEPIQVNGTLKRRITLRDARIPDADVSWTDVIARLEAARRDPLQARTRSLALDHVAEPAVGLVPDKAWDDPTVHPELLEEVAAATIPPLDSLTPDEAFFAALSTRIADMGDASGLHTLGTLHTYYGL